LPFNLNNQEEVNSEVYPTPLAPILRSISSLLKSLKDTSKIKFLVGKVAT